MSARWVFLCSIVVVLLLSVAVLAKPADSAVDWKSIEQNGCVLKYEDADEGLAKQLLPEIVKRVESVKSGKSPSQLELLSAKRKELLAAVAEEYGIERPSKDMGKVLDECLKVLLPLQEAVRKCRVFELRRQDADEPLENESVSFEFSSDSKSFSWLLRSTEGEKRKSTLDFDTVPVFVPKDSEGTDFEKALKSLDEIFDLPAAGIVGHELAEITLMLHLKMQGAYDRWFSDGVGTYVGVKVIEDVLGKGAADALKHAYDAREHADMAEKIDLLAWRNSAWETDMPFVQPRVTSACYAFSYKEMKELVERHGNDTMKRICSAVISSKDKVRNEKTLIDAIKSVTGEDMRKVLGKYGSKSEDKFRGIAIKGFACRTFAVKNGKAQLGEDSTVIELVNKDRQGLVVGFNVALMDRSASFDAWFVVSPGRRLGFASKAVVASEGSEQFVVLPIECSRLCHYQPGEYPVEITLNGQVLKEIKLKLVKPGSASSSTK